MSEPGELLFGFRLNSLSHSLFVLFSINTFPQYSFGRASVWRTCLPKSWHFMPKALLREKMRWPHDRTAFPVGNKALFGIKLGLNSALAMYLDTNEYRISCVSWSYWIWKERTARQQISDTCFVPSRSRSLIGGIYELILRNTGRREWREGGHHSSLALGACSHHPSLALLIRLQYPALKVRAPH